MKMVLVANTPVSCQPKLGQDFIDKIEKSWTAEETEERTTAAIKHLSQYIPTFSTAHVGSKPLFGAQQIPGDDPTLRVAEVTFARDRYARCEIVKVSSVLDMVDAIAKELVALEYLNASVVGKRVFNKTLVLENSTITQRAEKIAESRNYPAMLANRIVGKR